MKRILLLSLRILAVLVLAAAIGAASLFLGRTPLSASASGKTAGPAPAISPEDSIIINEVMSSNTKFYTSDGSHSDDWVELYNTTDKDISLEDYALTDSSKKLKKWPFPGVEIKAHGFLVISLTGDISSNISKGVIHCSFKLDADGESLYLVGPDGRIADYVEVPRIPQNTSYGLINGEWHSINNPTPGYANDDEGYSDYVKSVSVNG